MLSKYNVPATDTECWNKYPKYRWLFETSKLFEAQNKKWSFVKDSKFNCVYQTSSFDRPFTSMFLKYSSTATLGELYVQDADNTDTMHTDVVIRKGEITWFKHHKYNSFIDEINAEVELRISAFIIMNFAKWNGVLSIKTISNEIYAVKCMPSNMLTQYPEKVIEQLKKIYKLKS